MAAKKTIKKKNWILLESSSFFYYDRTILSVVLTNTRAAEIGTTITTTAKITLLKNALNDGVISLILVKLTND